MASCFLQARHHVAPLPSQRARSVERLRILSPDRHLTSLIVTRRRNREGPERRAEIAKSRANIGEVPKTSGFMRLRNITGKTGYYESPKLRKHVTGCNITPVHPGELVAKKVGYFWVKSTKVCRAQMGTKPAKVGRLGPRCAKVRRGPHPAPTGASAK